MSADHLINSELINHTKQLLGGLQKRAFVPSGDPSMGGAPPGGDPSMGGGAPPGGDPSGGGGDPSGGGGGGGPDPMVAQLMQQVQQMQQQMQQMGGGGAGGAGGAGAGALKPKIDVNSVMLQILKILARIADQLGVKIPASEMVINQQDLGQLAAATQTGGAMPGMDPSLGGGGGAPPGGGGAVGGMPPMDPMQGAGQPGMAQKAGNYRPQGEAFDTSGFTTTCSRAQMIAQIRNARRAS